MSVRRTVSAVVVAVLAMAGCTSGPHQAARPTPSVWAQATGDTVVIGPADSTAGSKKFEMDGVSFSAPQGWEPVRRETDGYVQISFADPDIPGAGVLITVTKDPGDPDVAEQSATAAFASLALNGASDLDQRPASWDAWDYATAVTGTVHPAGTRAQDYLLVVAVSGHLVVGVSAQSAGKLDGSKAFGVLQSLRAVG